MTTLQVDLDRYDKKAPIQHLRHYADDLRTAPIPGDIVRLAPSRVAGFMTGDRAIRAPEVPAP